MKTLIIKAQKIEDLFLAMTVFNLNELVNIKFDYSGTDKTNIIIASYGLLTNATLKNRIKTINLLTSEKLEFKTL